MRWQATGVLGTFLIATLLGCAELQEDRRQTGAILGGAAGAAIGSEVGDSTTATIIGAIAGGIIGAQIGERMEQQDRARTAQALETNERVSWRNPQTGNDFTVDPTGTYRTEEGRLCRDFTMDARIDGRTQEVSGTACRQPDGTWRTIESG